MSAQKQCPKCGEKNPAEAVMCWACYTSLTGGGAVGSGASALAGAAPMGDSAAISDSGEKKSIEPKQLAIVGVVVLLGALGFGVNTMMGSGPPEDDFGDLGGGTPSSVSKEPSGGGAPSVTVGSVNVPLPPTSGGGGAGNPAPPAQYYRVVVSPNPKQKWGTAVLVPTSGKVDEATARGYAMLAKQNFDRIKKFPAMEILVISDGEAAEVLRRYQVQRQNAPLTEQQYRDSGLSNVWGSTILRYVYNGGKSSFSYPAKNPSGFWNDSR